MTHISSPNSFSDYLDVKKKVLLVVGKVDSETKNKKYSKNSFPYLLTFPKPRLMIEII